MINNNKSTFKKKSSKRKREKTLEEIMNQHFPNLMKNINLCIQETPNGVTLKRSTLRHVIVKLGRQRRRENFEGNKRECKERWIRLTANFSLEAMESGGNEWQIQMLKEKSSN